MMTMIKIWCFVKKYWLELVAFLSSVIAAVLFALVKKEQSIPKENSVADIEQEAKDKKALAEKEAAEKIEEAKRLAELQKQLDDLKAKETREITEKKIDVAVEDRSKTDLEQPEKIAEGFAKDFGGKNVKTEE